MEHPTNTTMPITKLREEIMHLPELLARRGTGNDHQAWQPNSCYHCL